MVSASSGIRLKAVANFGLGFIIRHKPNSGFGHTLNSEIIKLVPILYFASIVTESSTLEAHSNNLLVGVSGNLILIDLKFVAGLNPSPASSSVSAFSLKSNLQFAFAKQITEKIKIKN